MLIQIQTKNVKIATVYEIDLFEKKNAFFREH